MIIYLIALILEQRKHQMDQEPPKRASRKDENSQLECKLNYLDYKSTSRNLHATPNMIKLYRKFCKTW